VCVSIWGNRRWCVWWRTAFRVLFFSFDDERRVGLQETTKKNATPKERIIWILNFTFHSFFLFQMLWVSIIKLTTVHLPNKRKMENIWREPALESD
jgi:hypothetical protein